MTLTLTVPGLTSLLPDAWADAISPVTDALAAALRTRGSLAWKTPAEALNEHLPSLQEAGVATTG